MDEAVKDATLARQNVCAKIRLATLKDVGHALKTRKLRCGETLLRRDTEFTKEATSSHVAGDGFNDSVQSLNEKKERMERMDHKLLLRQIH